MKDWHYSVNSFHKTANINVDILSRRLFCLERIIEFVCDYFPNIPFPSFLHVTDKDDGTVYTWKEWWGGTQGWFHCTIHSPIFNYVYNSGRCNGFCFPVDYDELKERFKDIDKKYWKSVEEFNKEV